jgi:predicted Zn finger-like uncharacterized protein
MLIVCPNCATSYQIDPSSLGAAGRSVRCARCKQMWFAANPGAIAAIARSHQADVVAFTAATSVIDFVARPAQPAAPSPPPPPAPAADFSVVDVGPPPAPAHAHAAMPPGAPPEPELVRDDRGPAPLPEPAGYQVPAEQPVVDVAAAPASDEPAAPVERAVPEDIETVAARRMRRNAARRRSKSQWLSVSTAILALIAINIGLVAWRTDIVRFLPQTASLYAAIGLPVNLRGLEFIDIVTRKETQDGVQMLVVEGFIKSHSRRKADVPRLRFAVRNASGHEIYSWTAMPARSVIPPGSTLPFRSRLASPPPEAHAVLVRFFNRRDLVAGVQ